MNRLQYFIGQEKIKEQLEKIYMPLLMQGDKFNFLIKAPSGMGKTTLARMIVDEIWDSTGQGKEIAWLFLPDETGSVNEEYFNRPFIIIDEAHLLKNQEMLYPHLDKRERTFLICTNEFGQLKEPLQNRCINFIFTPYTPDEIKQIIINYSVSLGFTFNQIDCVVKAGGLNPRVSKGILESLYNYQKAGNYLPTSEQGVLDIITNLLDIENGLNNLQRRYLEFLRTAESASLDLLSYVLRVDKMTIKRDTEPVLVERGLIGIGARGRFIKKP